MIAGLEDLKAQALSHGETVEATYQIALAAINSDIPGDFVECGVFAGAQAAAMARASMESGGHRLVHLFDSFNGIPAAGPKDKEFLEAGHKPGLSKCSLKDVQKNMEKWGIDPFILRYHPGWYEETMLGCDIGSIAVLRLDSDLYASTSTCLRYLYDRLSLGGWCIVDDFNLSGCREALFEKVVPAPIYFRKLW